MNVTMKLTLDGLIRALRLKAHGLAEQAEQDYRRAVRQGARRTERHKIVSASERGAPE